MRSRKVVRLSLVRNERKASEAKLVRRRMFEFARGTAQAHGDELSGFVMLAWKRDGEMRTVLATGFGPYDWGAIPHQMHDALQRHVAVRLAMTAQDATDEDEGA